MWGHEASGFGEHVEGFHQRILARPRPATSADAGARRRVGEEEDGSLGDSWTVRVTRVSPLTASFVTPEPLSLSPLRSVSRGDKLSPVLTCCDSSWGRGARLSPLLIWGDARPPRLPACAARVRFPLD